MPFAVWARGEKGNGNSQNINVEKLNKQPTTLLTFSADTNNDGIDDGDLKLNFTPDGSVDPNTVIYLDTDGDGIADSAPQTFTMEIGGTLPNKAKLNGVGPNNENLGGEEIVVLTLEDGTRLFFLRDFIFDPADTAASDDNFDLMEDFPSGGYSLVTPFVCYVAGTKIETTAGTKPVEELKVGDLISTESGASKPILYIASQSLPKSSIRAFPKLRPVLIPKNTLEALQPSQDLLVSPQHRILIRDPEIQLLFGMDAAFVAARELPFARLAPVKATYVVAFTG
ncbi:MAG: Hint domain-containing protein, partial [Boseongicola sp.]|nr:Hint domain-containing protein [Boseongicola sp.]